MTRLAEKPFALIGVNTNNCDTKKLKEITVKENMNWRSTADRGNIAPKWNSPGTPVYYILDPAGVIRYKWVGYPGQRALDAALEKLINQAERHAKSALK